MQSLTTEQQLRLLHSLGRATVELGQAESESEALYALGRLLAACADILEKPACRHALLLGANEAFMVERPTKLSAAEFTTLRVAAGISQAKVSAALGVVKSSINMWEKGIRPIPRKHIPALLDLFGVQPKIRLSEAA